MTNRERVALEKLHKNTEELIRLGHDALRGAISWRAAASQGKKLRDQSTKILDTLR